MSIFTKTALLEDINRWLSFVALQFKGASVLRFTNDNLMAEDFFAELLNRVYDLGFVNANASQANAPGVDLVDARNRICAQVTTDSSMKKVKKTFKVFKGHGLEQQYDRLIMVYPKMDRPKRKTQTKAAKTKTAKTKTAKTKTAKTKTDLGLPAGFKFSFDTDEKCFLDILDECMVRDEPWLLDLLEWLNSTIRNAAVPALGGADLSVQRLIEVIRYLTTQEPEEDVEGPEAMPDPEGKLGRFPLYREYLEAQYMENVSAHVSVEAAKEAVGYDGIKARRSSSHLRQRSRSLLEEHDGNAMAAFDALVNELAHQTGATGKSFESSSIRYLVAHEMTTCNVFPNSIGGGP